MTSAPSIDRALPLVLQRDRAWLREVVARRHGRRRNPARMTPRSSLRTPTNRPAHHAQRWVEKVGRSITNSDTPHRAARAGAQTRPTRAQPRPRARLLLRLTDHDHGDRRTDNATLAQTPFHRHGTQRLQPSRPLQTTHQPHRDHGLSSRTLTASPPRLVDLDQKRDRRVLDWNFPFYSGASPR
jgi:hypothetical protein